MTTLSVLSPWTGSGSTPQDALRPLLASLYALDGWTDVTGTPAANLPPSPNLAVIECVCTDVVATAIAADNRFSVLWVDNAAG